MLSNRTRLPFVGRSLIILLLLLFFFSQPWPVLAMPPHQVLTADGDSDGLTDTAETTLGTNPAHPDSDCDTKDDAREVGSLDQPGDADGDGRIDAIESSRADADQDGTPDELDPDLAPQVVCGRFTPWALPADASQTSLLAIRLLLPRDVISVAVTMQQADWAGLELDGAAVTDGTDVELFDDGTNGDVVAGDGFWSRGGWTLRRNFSTGERRWAEVSQVKVTQPGQQVTTLPGGLTTARYGFYRMVLGAVAPADLLPVTELAPGLQRSSHLLNLVAPLPGVSIQARDVAPATVTLLQQIYDGFDFLYLFPDEPADLPVSGQSWLVRNDTDHIGQASIDRGQTYGSRGRLQSVVLLNFGTSGPTIHQTMHRWAGFGLEGLGFGQCASVGHWGVSGVGRGQLGGFDPASLTDNGNGTFTVGTFFANANGGDGTALAPLELYLAGLLPGADVPPIPVPQNVYCASLAYDPLAGTVTFAADGLNTVTMAQVQTQLGGERTAGPSGFTGLFVAVSHRPWTGPEMAFYNGWAKRFGAETGSGGLLSFRQATGNRATMDTNTDNVFLVQELFLPNVEK